MKRRCSLRAEIGSFASFRWRKSARAVGTFCGDMAGNEIVQTVSAQSVFPSIRPTVSNKSDFHQIPPAASGKSGANSCCFPDLSA